MKVLKGITASPGIVKGAACLYLEKREEDIPHYGIEAERVEAEVSRLDEALNNHFFEIRIDYDTPLILEITHQVFCKFSC